MGFISQIFGLQAAKPVPAKTHSQFSHSVQPKVTATSTNSRRELLRVALRSTLNRQGIPPAWIGAEMLQATAQGREPGIHLRLLIRHWDPQLLACCVALQNTVIVRLMALDPLASNWLMGISWQFALPDESVCPPLPHPGAWTGDLNSHAGNSVAEKSAGGSGDVIAGPVRIGSAGAPSVADPDSHADVKSDLERLLAVRDAELERHAGKHGGSEPVFLSTQPMGLPPRDA